MGGPARLAGRAPASGRSPDLDRALDGALLRVEHPPPATRKPTATVCASTSIRQNPGVWGSSARVPKATRLVKMWQTTPRRTPQSPRQRAQPDALGQHRDHVDGVHVEQGKQDAARRWPPAGHRWITSWMSRNRCSSMMPGSTEPSATKPNTTGGTLLDGPRILRWVESRVDHEPAEGPGAERARHCGGSHLRGAPPPGGEPLPWRRRPRRGRGIGSSAASRWQQSGLRQAGREVLLEGFGRGVEAQEGGDDHRGPTAPCAHRAATHTAKQGQTRGFWSDMMDSCSAEWVSGPAAVVHPRSVSTRRRPDDTSGWKPRGAPQRTTVRFSADSHLPPSSPPREA